jgi:hypothetical protein
MATPVCIVALTFFFFLFHCSFGHFRSSTNQVRHFEEAADQAAEAASSAAKERARAAARGQKPPPLKADESPNDTVRMIMVLMDG